ncbi:hypothetical protein J2S05_002192 [Alkalicoccobacillus murimartini]|uniref:Uncharacterized protein n=1 Tax=Alkalicoccobacillus murimartini TaxID=171685 RepID=A0ABT9YHQ9_9BACI|nr:hypothetical protein [Alkalicoccobacillus murimartini]
MIAFLVTVTKHVVVHLKPFKKSVTGKVLSFLQKGVWMNFHAPFVIALEAYSRIAFLYPVIVLIW